MSSTNIMSAAPSTGPRSDEGKSISSKNATTSGLYAADDYILPEEQSLYADLENAVISELSPQGMLECRLVEEILGAMWRLRRCRKLEGELAAQPDDPMQPESAHSKRQLSIDRARNQTTRLLHKNTAELRRVQTERHYRHEIAADGIDTTGLGVCDLHTVLSHTDRDVKNIERRPLDQLKLKLEALALESELGSTLASQPGSGIGSPTSEITKRTPPPQPEKQPPPPEIARGALCPCNSGQKYKRCCGKNAPPLLQHLARAA